MEYLIILLLGFIVTLLMMQIVFFEIARSKAIKADNLKWFSALDKPFQYNRVGYMIFICFICYLISSPEDMFTLEWIVYFVLFLAIGIVADAIVQYLVLAYSKVRCRNEISEVRYLENKLQNITQTLHEDNSWNESEKQFDVVEILHDMIQPKDHIAIMSVDKGEFVKNYQPLPEATFVIEPYSDKKEIEQMFIDNDSVKVTQLTETSQMPFKDERLDVVVCEKTNYDKCELYRILKENGYAVIHQNGTANLKEFVKLYMPFGMKGSWDAYQCAELLEGIGFQVVQKRDDYGTVRFYSIDALHQYIVKNVPELADINRYKMFYLQALRSIESQSFFELTTHEFVVVVRKLENSDKLILD